MQLAMDAKLADDYKSRSQMVRVVTEAWAANNMYCPTCSSDSLRQSPNNAKAVDFYCSACSATFQLKASASRIANHVMDGEYNTMMAALRTGTRPNLLVMHYSEHWNVQNLLLVPSFFFIPAAIQQRKPLGPTARRAGWTGCNILLDQIAPEGKLPIVEDGVLLDPVLVRSQYEKVKPIATIPLGVRGWTLDVLRLIHSLNTSTFDLTDIYAFDDSIRQLHPDNNNIRAKMRQRLQVLRDLGFIRFLGHGRYELIGV